MALGMKSEAPRRRVMEHITWGRRLLFETVRVPNAGAPVKEVVLTGNQGEIYVACRSPACQRDDGSLSLSDHHIALSKHRAGTTIVGIGCMVIDGDGTSAYGCCCDIAGEAISWRQNSASPPRPDSALVQRHHPAFYLVGAGLTKMDQDEYRTAGGVMGEGVRVVGSETLGDEALPADADIVLEGEIVVESRPSRALRGVHGIRGPAATSWPSR